MSARKFSLWRTVSLCLMVCLLLPSVLAAAPAEPVETEPLEGLLFPDTASAAEEPLTLLEPGEMKDISNGIMSAYIKHFPHHNYPDYIVDFYPDLSDGTLIISLTDTSDATLDELRADLRASDVKGKYTQWFPMIVFRKVRYSIDQLFECEAQVRQLIADAGLDCRIRSRCDAYANQVVLFFDAEDPLVVEEAVAIANEYAETLANEYDMPDMLLALPYAQKSAYWEEHDRIYGAKSWEKETAQDEPPADAAQGAIGFTACLTYCGRDGFFTDGAAQSSPTGAAFLSAIHTAPSQMLLRGFWNPATMSQATNAIVLKTANSEEYRITVSVRSMTSSMTVRVSKLSNHIPVTVYAFTATLPRKSASAQTLLSTIESSAGTIRMRFRYPATAVVRSMHTTLVTPEA